MKTQMEVERDLMVKVFRTLTPQEQDAVIKYFSIIGTMHMTAQLLYEIFQAKAETEHPGAK